MTENHLKTGGEQVRCSLSESMMMKIRSPSPTSRSREVCACGVCRWQYASKHRQVDPECSRIFELLKIRRKHRFIVYKIDSDTEAVVPETIGPRAGGLVSLYVGASRSQSRRLTSRQPFPRTTLATLSTTTNSPLTTAVRPTSSSSSPGFLQTRREVPNRLPSTPRADALLENGLHASQDSRSRRERPCAHTLTSQPERRAGLYGRLRRHVPNAVRTPASSSLPTTVSTRISRRSEVESMIMGVPEEEEDQEFGDDDF